MANLKVSTFRDMDEISKCLLIIFNLLIKLYIDIKKHALDKIMLNLEFFHIQSFEYESFAHIQSPPICPIFIISFNTMANFFLFIFY